MEWSYYNFLVNSKKFDCYLLYNSMSNAFIRLDEEQYKEILNFKENPTVELNKEWRDFLIQNGILVENNIEEYYKFKLLKLLKRYDTTCLSLTIAPTSDCNFRCPYCFENSPVSQYMDKSVEDAIILFIKKYKTLKSLHITWYGGEPLLAFDRIVSITNRIKELDIAFSSDIITNGFFFNEDVINKLDELHIYLVHITLDGLREMHNLRRPEKFGKDSFEEIIKNISIFKAKNVKAKIVIRINVDKENMEEYNKVYSFLLENYSSCISNIYPGFVKKSYGQCAYSERNLLSNEEQAQFVISQYNKYGIIDNTHFLPNINYTECLARCLNAFLIAPDGSLYKCWTDLGNLKESVGNVLNGDFNIKQISKYLIGGDPFSDKICQKCKFLPICGGGCPHMRLKNLFAGAKIDLCHISKNDINKFLELYYEEYIKNIDLHSNY